MSLQVVGVTGFILTKLDGSARGGCVVCLHFFLWFCSANILVIKDLVWYVGDPPAAILNVQYADAYAGIYAIVV